jgi:UDP-N-acetylenolpyruvoylglucosamine reductase
MFSELKALHKMLGASIDLNKNISPYLTFRTKVFAQYFFEAVTKTDIINAYDICKKMDIPFLFLGGGSNLAITKNFIPGLIVKNSYQEKKLVTEDSDSVDLQISSGYPMGKLVMETVAAGWEGFEYHLGLPGTIGGGVYMNSKWTRPVSNIGDNLVTASLYNGKSVRSENRNYFDFKYDYSILQETGEIVLEAIFKLKKNDPAVLKKRAQESLVYRKRTQPFGVSTCGCFFRNIDGRSAGQIIDVAGLKNKKIGSFIVSNKHANFIINEGEGDPSDLIELLSHIKNTVHDKLGIDLQEEVIVI